MGRLSGAFPSDVVEAFAYAFSIGSLCRVRLLGARSSAPTLPPRAAACNGLAPFAFTIAPSSIRTRTAAPPPHPAATSCAVAWRSSTALTSLGASSNRAVVSPRSIAQTRYLSLRNADPNALRVTPGSHYEQHFEASWNSWSRRSWRAVESDRGRRTTVYLRCLGARDPILRFTTAKATSRTPRWCATEQRTTVALSRGADRAGRWKGRW
jgi:hypothetical protein